MRQKHRIPRHTRHPPREGGLHWRTGGCINVDAQMRERRTLCAHLAVRGNLPAVGPQRTVKNWRKSVGVLAQPPRYRSGPRHRIKPARRPQAQRGKLWVQPLQPLQFAPDILLADQQIGVFRMGTDLHRRHGDRNRVAQVDQGEENLDLLRAQRVFGVIARDQGQDCGQRIRVPDQRIGAGHGQFHNAPAFHHIAEIQKPADKASVIQQDVVIIRIVVDHLTGTLGEYRQQTCREIL